MVFHSLSREVGWSAMPRSISPAIGATIGTDAITPAVVARRPLATTAQSTHSPQSGSRASERSAHSSERVKAARRSSLAATGSRSPWRQWLRAIRQARNADSGCAAASCS